MNIKIIAIALGGIVVVAGTVFFITTDKNTSDSSTEKAEKVVTTKASAPVVDIARCTKQPNDAYFCPPDALSNFGPVAVTDTASGNICEIGYSVSAGVSFKGKIKSGVVDAGPLAVALYPSGKIATVARSASKTMSFHVREDGTVDHALFVDSNYSTEQCVSVK